jgi:hypothetical protein
MKGLAEENATPPLASTFRPKDWGFRRFQGQIVGSAFFRFPPQIAETAWKSPITMCARQFGLLSVGKAFKLFL